MLITPESMARHLEHNGCTVYSPEIVAELPLDALEGLSWPVVGVLSLILARSGWAVIPPESAREPVPWLRRHGYAAACVSLSLIGWSIAIPMVVAR